MRGCANAYTGDEGYRDAEEMVRLAASQLRLAMRVGSASNFARRQRRAGRSTGVTGQRLPMERHPRRAAVDNAACRRRRALRPRHHDHRHRRRSRLRSRSPSEGANTESAAAPRASGMIHPNLATMLAFVTTRRRRRARRSCEQTLRQAAEASFDMITVDGDTSPNDTLLILANGAAGGPTLREGVEGAAQFREAVAQVCIELAKAHGPRRRRRDEAHRGEGRRAKSVADARARRPDRRRVAAREVGRLRQRPELGARAGRRRPQRRARRRERDEPLLAGRLRVSSEAPDDAYDEEALSAATKGDEVRIRVDLGLGERARRRLGLRPDGRVRAHQQRVHDVGESAWRRPSSSRLAAAPGRAATPRSTTSSRCSARGTASSSFTAAATW